MQVIKLVKYGAPEKAFAFEDVPRPEPAPDEVLIKVHVSGINFADVLARKGLYGDAPALPFVPGYEVVGTVAAIGKKVSGVSEGDRVIGFTRFNGYAAYVSAPTSGVVPLPKGFNMAEGAALATQYATAWQCACEAVRLYDTDRVLIHAAAGGVGTALVQLARYRGCTIFGTAGSDKKLEYLIKQGVDYPINYRKQDFVKEVLNVTGPERIDVVFDSVGGTVYRKSRKVLAYGGRMVCLGAAERTSSGKGKWGGIKLLWNYGLMLPVTYLLHSKGLVGVNMLRLADHKPHVVTRSLQNVYALAEKGHLKPYIGGRFKVKEVAKAHQFVEDRKSTGKVVLEWPE